MKADYDSCTECDSHNNDDGCDDGYDDVDDDYDDDDGCNDDDDVDGDNDDGDDDGCAPLQCGATVKWFHLSLSDPNQKRSLTWS